MQRSKKELEELRSKKEQIEQQKQGAVLEIEKYDAILFSSKELKNKERKTIYVVKKQIKGEIQYEFYVGQEKIGESNGEMGTIFYPPYDKKIDTTMLIAQLRDTMPVSMQSLEKLESKENIDEKENGQPERKTEQPESVRLDAEIDLNKKITENETFMQLIPGLEKEGFTRVGIKRIGMVGVEFLGVTKEGNVKPIPNLSSKEGTNPTQKVIGINQDGSQVEEKQVFAIMDIEGGKNEGHKNEGITVGIGPYGELQLGYFRREAGKENIDIPINLVNTNQKVTQKEVREFAQKQKNPGVADNIKYAEEEIETRPDEKTVLKNIDDNPDNNKIEDFSEVLIQKAAIRCKIYGTQEEQNVMSQEEKQQRYNDFRQRVIQAEGRTIQEKIDIVEEEENQNYRGDTGRKRA